MDVVCRIIQHFFLAKLVRLLRRHRPTRRHIAQVCMYNMPWIFFNAVFIPPVVTSRVEGGRQHAVRERAQPDLSLHKTNKECAQQKAKKNGPRTDGHWRAGDNKHRRKVKVYYYLKYALFKNEFDIRASSLTFAPVAYTRTHVYTRARAVFVGGDLGLQLPVERWVSDCRHRNLSAQRSAYQPVQFVR